ncbi:MAG: elongation factor P [Bacillota bacterium]
MISTNDLRTGLTVELDGDVYVVVEFQHVKPGKGAAFVRCKIRNMRTGSTVERTFRAGEKLPRAILDKRVMQYLYNDGENFVFMDTDNYEQVTLTRENLEDGAKYLKDNMTISVLMYKEKTIGIELPNSVELKVVETEPGIKGDTASGGSKTATVESGAVVQVPLFINVGDVLRIDTRTGAYIERA